MASDRGAELVEFALVLPVFLLMLGGMLDLGLLVSQYAVITNAAREGARVASIPGWDEAAVQARVTEYVEDAGLIPTSVETDVEFDVTVPAGAQSVSAVRVSVSYAYNYLLLDSLAEGFAGGTFTPTLTLRAASTMRTEVAPQL